MYILLFIGENLLLKASWSPDGKYIIAGSEDKTMYIIIYL